MSLKPNRAQQPSGLLLKSQTLCRPEADKGRLCSSHKLLPPEGEVGGRQREAENLEPSGVKSCEAASSWNRRKPHFLHWRTTRIRRSGNQGWHQTRTTSKRRNSWNTEMEEKTGFSLSTETESDLSPICRTKNFSDRRSTNQRTRVC